MESPGAYEGRSLNLTGTCTYTGFCVHLGPSSGARVVYHLVDVGGGPIPVVVGVNCKKGPTTEHKAEWQRVNARRVVQHVHV